MGRDVHDCLNWCCLRVDDRLEIGPLEGNCCQAIQVLNLNILQHSITHYIVTKGSKSLEAETTISLFPCKLSVLMNRSIIHFVTHTSVCVCVCVCVCVHCVCSNKTRTLHTQTHYTQSLSLSRFYRFNNFIRWLGAGPILNAS